MFVNRLKNNMVEVPDELDKPGLMKEKNYNAEHSTTDFGIRFRGFLHPLIHMGIRNAVDRPVDVIRYPNLLKGKNYIFAAGHFFPGRLLPISA